MTDQTAGTDTGDSHAVDEAAYLAVGAADRYIDDLPGIGARKRADRLRWDAWIGADLDIAQVEIAHDASRADASEQADVSCCGVRWRDRQIADRETLAVENGVERGCSITDRREVRNGTCVDAPAKRVCVWPNG